MDNRIQTLIKYLLPAIFTNVCVFLFGIIDGIFVGNGVGTNALGAVNIVMPFIMLTYGLNVLTSMGGVTIAAIRFGRGDTRGANEVFMHSLSLTVVVAAIISFCGTVLSEPISYLLGTSNTYVELVREYLFWYALFTIPSSLAVSLEHFCRNDGNPGLVAKATLYSTLANIFLDWLFVFPLKMGIMGAALASGLSQTLALFIMTAHFFGRKGSLRFIRFRPDSKLYRKILFRGSPDMISQFFSPVTIFCMNTVLAPNYGDLGINTYAIICYIASLALAIMYGVSEGLQPLFGRCYGAKNEEDLKYFFHAGLIIAVVGSSLCVLTTDLAAREICHLYGADLATTASTVVNLPKYSWAFILSGINALLSAYFFSTKRTGSSVILNVFRSFIFNTFCIFVLPMLFGKEIIWYTNSVAEIMVLILGVILIKITERSGIQYR